MKSIIVKGKTEYMDLDMSRIAIYSVSESEVVLIDSGYKVHPELEQFFADRHQKVIAVLCTHPHVDHVGNNELLFNIYGTMAYMYEDDLEDIRAKRWPFAYWKDTYPITCIPAGSTYIEIAGVRFDIIETPGHTKGHICYVTPDGVCFLGDALISRDVLSHSKLPYMDHVENAIRSMQHLLDTHYEYYICAHQGLIPYEEMADLIRLNVDKELMLFDQLKEMVTDPVPISILADQFMKSLGIDLSLRAIHVFRWTTCVRIYELEYAGVFEINMGLVSRT